MAYHGDQRAATAAHGEALAAAGWRLRGYKADHSDSMTDYYDPASWDGLADGPADTDLANLLLLVDVSEYDARRHREGFAVHGKAEEDCPVCQGTGREPRDVPGATTQRLAGTGPDGRMRLSPPETVRERKAGDPCAGPCKGVGRWTNHAAVIGRTAPEPRAVACPGRWRLVDADGAVIATGQRALKARRYADGAEDLIATFLRHVAEAVAKWRARRARSGQGASHAAETPLATGNGAASASASGVTLRPGRDATMIEVVFAARPPAEIRDALKAARFRWSSTAGCWYGAAEALPAAVSALAKPGSAQDSGAPDNTPEPMPCALWCDPRAGESGTVQHARTCPNAPHGDAQRLASNDCEFDVAGVERALCYVAEAAHRAGVGSYDLARIIERAYCRVGAELKAASRSGRPKLAPYTHAPLDRGEERATDANDT